MSVAGDRASTARYARTFTAGASREKRLTPRELEILQALATGLENKAIVRKLEISEKTVRNHVASIYRKLGTSNRVEATLYAQRHGLVRVAPEAPDPDPTGMTSLWKQVAVILAEASRRLAKAEQEKGKQP